MEYKGEASWKRRRNVVGLCGGHGGRGMSGVGQTTAQLDAWAAVDFRDSRTR